jgi:RNA polymerase sigma-70 factor (ECF subfamily)
LARSRRSESSPKRDSRTALIELARQGDAQALGDLLERFRPSLNDLARQLLSPAIAQKVGASDLVQETCLEAMRDFGTARVRDVAGMQAWLTTLLANNVKDWQRKYRSSKKRDLRRERPLDEVGSRIDGRKAALVSADESPPARAIKTESRDLVQQAFKRLGRGYQQIIVWRTEERQSWQEIARRLDRSEDAVRMLWKRAVARLKREILDSP